MCSLLEALYMVLTIPGSSVLANGVFPAPLITGNKGDAFSLTVADQLTDDTMDLVTSIVSTYVASITGASLTAQRLALAWSFPEEHGVC